MCGIAGILNFDRSPVEEDELHTMTDAIAHRGPDGEGFYIDKFLGLGHRRLAILDLEDTGKQPMSYADERYWIVYNGEVYNFVELRHQLETRGYQFHSTGDTEVVVAAYDCWGSECLLRFNGMWAFAIWDSRERVLFLSRDRFGVKPLFFSYTSHRFAFASEIKGLLKVTDRALQPNYLVIRDILSGGTGDTDKNTVFENIYRLGAGSFMKITSDGIGPETNWWNTWSNRVEVPKTRDQQVEMFRDLFEDACRIRLRSDVPVGTLLSGGMDSSSIACTIAKHRENPTWTGANQRLAPDWQNTFTAEYPGMSADEAKYAHDVLDVCGLKGIFIRPVADDIANVFNQLVEQQDTPIGATLIAIHGVYRNVAEHGIKVTLDGQGADEVLSGYEAISAARYYLSRFNLVEMRNAIKCQASLTSATGTANQILNQLLISEVRRRVALRSNVRRLMHKPRILPSEPENGAPARQLQALPDPGSDWFPPTDANILDKELYRQLHRTTLPGILRLYDHAAMAYSVESRMPFMDWRLIVYCLSLPVEQKVSQGYTKVILRQAMQGLLPTSVIERRSKFGFPVPTEWMNNPEVQVWVRSIIYDPRFCKMDYWNGPRLINWFESKSQSPWSGSEKNRLFSVITTFLWHIMHWGSQAL